LKRTLLERLLTLGRAGTPVGLVTHLTTGLQSLVTRANVEGDLAFVSEELRQIRRAVDDDRSGVLEIASGALFIEIWNPSVPRVRAIRVSPVREVRSLGAQNVSNRRKLTGGY